MFEGKLVIRKTIHPDILYGAAGCLRGSRAFSYATTQGNHVVGLKRLDYSQEFHPDILYGAAGCLTSLWGIPTKNFHPDILYGAAECLTSLCEWEFEFTDIQI